VRTPKKGEKEMKQMKNESAKTNFYGKKVVLILLILGLTAICLAIKPFARLQSAQTSSEAKAKPTPPDEEDEALNEEALRELIERLKDSLNEAIEDEADQKAILENWEERMDELKGKTEKQVIEILFEDVKSVAKDKEITDKIWDEWNSDNDETKSEGNTTAVLDDKKKKDVIILEMGPFFDLMKKVKFVKQDPYSFKNQRYTIYTDPADPDTKFKVDAVKKAVETIINKGLKIPDNLQIYCTSWSEAQNRAFPRDENWRPVANVTLRWGTDTPRIGDSLSAKGFRGFERSTISMVHEIGHILHERNTGDVFFHGKGSIIQGKPDSRTAAKVSGYAMGNKKEFVAEVFTGLIFGMKFDSDVMAEYEKYKGPKVP
jgi:hypothetical protein